MSRFAHSNEKLYKVYGDTRKARTSRHVEYAGGQRCYMLPWSYPR